MKTVRDFNKEDIIIFIGHSSKNFHIVKMADYRDDKYAEHFTKGIVVKPDETEAPEGNVYYWGEECVLAGEEEIKLYNKYIKED